MLYDIASAYPSVDLTWANHFFATLFDHNRHLYAQERDDDQITTTVAVAAEFIEPHLNLKMYLKSRRLGMRETPLEVYKEAISQVCPVSAAATSLYEFLNNDPEGQLLKPAILGLDCVSAPNSRIKLYFRTPRVRFTTIHTIMTLNNRKTVSAHQIEPLRTLLAAVTGLPPDFPDDADWPINDRFKDLVYTRSAKIPLVYPACGFYFDIAPGREVPNVKV
ncbi:hypothetical protein N0V95_002889 [Ascochyta clinopodiicola]|nr:hypothetical protein N0V95_002889 [Ascochyta clinopodiicola]